MSVFRSWAPCALWWALALILAGCPATPPGGQGADATASDRTQGDADAATGGELPPADGETDGLDPGDVTDPPVEGPGLGIDWAAEPPGVSPRYAPGSDDWTATGWPSDRYRGADGSVDLSHFPNPDEDLLTTYIAYGMAHLDGFGLNSATYLQFEGEVDEGSLPSPGESVDPLSVVQLVNVTEGSSRYGEQVPLRFHWQPLSADPYYLPLTLALRPVYGRPMTEGETYCALITRGVRDLDGHYLSAAPAFVDALDVEPSLEPLMAWMDVSPLRVSDLAVATCFTTQRATDELRRVAEAVEASPPAEVLSIQEPTVHGEFHGTYLTPNFQQGEIPYESEGGGFIFNADGAPEVQMEELVRFMMRVPHDLPMPDEGWPVVLYAHGTGGDYESCRGVDELVQMGYGMICIDQPLHGSRGAELNLADGELILYSFNFLNPPAGRTGFRQSAVDTLHLSHMVAAGRFDLAAGETDDGMEVRLDPERILFFGHSHGALSGALAMAVDSRIRGGVLSGGSGILIETILRRKDPVDLATLTASLLLIPPESLDSFHPVLNLVQTLVDATDPVNYAASWLHPADGQPAKHVFITEGTADAASPAVGTDAVGSAAGIPLLRPIAKASDGHDLGGLLSATPPVSLNGAAAEGSRTVGLKQWQGGNHFVAFNTPEARAMWRTFFRSFLDEGAPTIGIGDEAVPTTADIAATDSCAGAAVTPVGASPVVVHGDTSTAANTYSVDGCGGLTGGAEQRDRVFGIRVESPGTYRLHLTIPAGPDEDTPREGPNLLAVTSSCGDLSAEVCEGATGEGVLDVSLDDGLDYFIHVDGSAPPHRGTFWVTIERLCAALTCEDRVCGDWGCGSCGTCESGTRCDDAGACVPTAAGDRCEDAIEVAGLPWIATGDTRLYAPDYSYAGGDCPGESSGYGAASSDSAYRFVAPTAGVFNVRLDAEFAGNLYAVSDCEDVAASCLQASRVGGGGEALQLSLGGGETVYLIVDGYGNSSDDAGPYTVRLEPCLPQCDVKACGDDGCGGQCGDCDEVTRCVEDTLCEPIPYLCEPEGICEEVATGDRCADPHEIDSVPFSGGGSTAGYYQDYGYSSGACPGESGGWGAGSNDVVYRFVPEETSLYRMKVNSSYDSNLYVVTDCEDVSGSCVAGREDKGSQKNESFYTTLEAGQTYFVVVDGRGNQSNSNGGYTLTVSSCTPSCAGKLCGSDGCGGSCGSCGSLETCNSGGCVDTPGISCEVPRAIGKLPYEHEGHSGDYGDLHWNGCTDEGEGANDVAYRFTPTEDGTYHAAVSGGWDASLSVITTCPPTPADCAAGVSGGSLVFDASADVTYHLLLDGAAPGAGGDFTLLLDHYCPPDCEGRSCGDDGCGGSCGDCAYPADLCDMEGQCRTPDEVAGNTCADPMVIPAGELPFTGQGDTSLGFNHLAFGTEHCPGWVAKGRGGADQVWRLDPPADGTYTIGVVADGWDAAVYAVGDCDAIATTCLAAGDGQMTDSLQVAGAAGQPIYVVVDSADNVAFDEGAYTITVSAPW